MSFCLLFVFLRHEVVNAFEVERHAESFHIDSEFSVSIRIIHHFSLTIVISLFLHVFFCVVLQCLFELVNIIVSVILDSFAFL